MGSMIRMARTGHYGTVVSTFGLIDSRGYFKDEDTVEVILHTNSGSDSHVVLDREDFTNTCYLGQTDDLKRSLYIFVNPTMDGDEEFRIKDPNNPKRKIKITKHKEVAIVARSSEHAYLLYDGHEWNRDWELKRVEELGSGWNSNKSIDQLTDIDWV